MSRHTVKKGLALAFLLLGGGILKAFASPVEVQVVIAGEINRQTGSVKITSGELQQRSFGSIASAMEAMKKAGYPSPAVDHLKTTLERSIEELKVVQQRGKRGRLADALHDQIPNSKEISLVEVERRNAREFEFKVLVGSQDEIGRQYDLDKCEKMNERCFICPDKRIRCKIDPLTKRAQQS